MTNPGSRLVFNSLVMKTFCLFIGLGLLTALGLAATPNDGLEALQRGLFEEDANQNLEAAIQAYQAVLTRAEEQRKIAATAVFRLGECYRKLGRTNDAVAFYERVLREYSDQAVLTRVSEQNLYALGAGARVRSLATPLEAASPEEQRELARLKTILRDSPDLLLEPRGTGEKALFEAIKLGYQAVVRFLIENKMDPNLRFRIGPQSSASALNSILDPSWLFQNQSPTPLLVAVRCGNKAIAQFLLDHGAEVNAAPPGGPAYAPLHIAAHEGFKAVAELLIERKADLNQRDGAGETPLHVAVSQGSLPLAQLLLEHGAAPDLPDHMGHTPLMKAAQGPPKLVELLLGRSPNLLARATNGWTLLHGAARAGEAALVKRALAAGADPNALCDEPDASLVLHRLSTPLHAAAYAGATNVIPLLVAAGANVNATNREGRTPLLQAILDQRPPATVAALLAAHADVNRSGANGQFPLAVASLATSPDQSSFTTFQLVLAAKPDLEHTNSDGDTALLLATKRPRPGIVEPLLAAGANPNVLDAAGRSPLLIAVSNSLAVDDDSAKVMRLLLARHPNLEIRGRYGLTALFLAVSERKAWAVADLLAAGANPNTRADSGGAVLFNAIYQGNQPILNLLLARKPDLEILNEDKCTPLGYALDFTTNAVAALLQAGANPNVMLGGRHRGLTPLSYAARDHNPGLARLLLDHKANPNFRSTQGDTPLTEVLSLVWASDSPASDRQKEMAALLRRHGAKTNQELESGASRPPAQTRASAKASSSDMLTAGPWQQLASASMLAPRSAHKVAWTGQELLVFGGYAPGRTFGDGARFHPKTGQWKSLPTEPGSASGRRAFSAAWTGKEWIIWGGAGGAHGQPVLYGTGARYDLAADAWKPLSKEGAPSPRFDHATVWTGKEMIVWGGYANEPAGWRGGREPYHLGDGGRYDPATDSWKPVSMLNAPSKRTAPSAVWTGTHLIIWGGLGEEGPLGDGASYDPLDDYWRPLPKENAPSARWMHQLLWTGTEVLVLGGAESDGRSWPEDGAAYNPATRTWRRIKNAPMHAVLAWTGHDVLAWGGYVDEHGRTQDPAVDRRKAQLGWDEAAVGSYRRMLQRYDPVKDAWTPLTAAGGPPAVAGPGVWTGQGLLLFGGGNDPTYYHDTWFYDPAKDPGPAVATGGVWRHLPSELPGRIFHSAIWTGEKMLVWGGGGGGQFFNDGGLFTPDTGQWKPMSTDNAPSPRWAHAAVWTGREMLVWGGRDQFAAADHKDTGGRYDPARDQWKPLSQVGAPEARSHLAAVWTGRELLIWGGWGDGQTAFRDGARYDPVTDQWTALPPVDLQARMDPAFVWTGAEFIVWGGSSGDSKRTFGDGARYNPTTGSWTLLPTQGAPASARLLTAVWTGQEMLLWSGYHIPSEQDPKTPVWAAGRYNPKTDSWTPMAFSSTVPGRHSCGTVWTGTEMVVWGGGVQGGSDALSTGARYNPTTDSWTPMTDENAGRARFYPSALWTGRGVLFFGGSQGGSEAFNDLDYYLPYQPDEPKPSPGPTWEKRASAPFEPRHCNTAVWTGQEMITFGGEGPGVSFGDGARYNPSTDRWTKLPEEPGSQRGRTQHRAVWTGDEMIIWGGFGGKSGDAPLVYGTGARYHLKENAWSPLSADGAPSPRFNHTVVWTDKEMLVWGGYTDGATAYQGCHLDCHRNDGACYNPATDSWRTLSTANAPSKRSGAAAVWTGQELIVWGGGNENEALRDGGRYLPAFDRWLPLPTEGAPSARVGAQAFWTGREMIVLGGYSRDYQVMYQDGAAFSLETGRWRSLPAGGVRSLALWTGQEILTWGGRLDGTWVNTGMRYNPEKRKQTWAAISTLGAPSPRGQPSWGAVWTGEGLLFCGGWNGGQYFNETYYYRPDRDTGSVPTQAARPTDQTHSPTGVPQASAWEKRSIAPLEPRKDFTAVWTGDAMILFGGRTQEEKAAYEDGARYSLATDAWSLLPQDPQSKGGRWNHSAVWTGREMLVFGGHLKRLADGQSCGLGSAYDPKKREWRTLSTNGAPAARSLHTAVWTGAEMIVWGGRPDNGWEAARSWRDGARYQPETDTWKPISATNAPAGRNGHRAFWTGREMLVWGGTDGSVPLADGASYDPAKDQWTPLPPCPESQGRESACVVWTGQEMIVWGGIKPESKWCHDGWRYHFEKRTWTSFQGPPGTEASRPFAVWTGAELLLWGGNLPTVAPSDGARPSSLPGSAVLAYHPGLDRWRTVHAAADAPPPRTARGSAVFWTGQSALFYGGSAPGKGLVNDAWLYSPSNVPANPTAELRDL